MTPTREQLELAAKAVGLTYYGYDVHKGLQLDKPYDIRHITWWNPVTTKSDSFDLMVVCGIEPMFHDCAVSALSGSDFHTEPVYWLDQDKGLATMWAVFLCAVEIGRAM
jgi:hypothetical protein